MNMQSRSMIAAVVGSVVILAIVLEGIRRKRLAEQYSLIWLLTSLVLLVLAAWPGLLHAISLTIGIYYPPTALFVIGFGFVLLILLQFSAAISKLTQENRDLAQRIGIMQQQLDELLQERDKAAPSDKDGDK